MTQPHLRPMTSADIPAGMRLKTVAGWNQTVADWHTLLALNPTGCFVAEVAGQVVGTVTTTNYADRLAWIGMVLVDPAFRRQGIATRLTERALSSLPANATIKLDATPLGQAVYERLGFVTEYGLHRLVLEQVPPLELIDAAVAPLTAADWSSIAALDQAAFGADRVSLLQRWVAQNPNTAFVYQDDHFSGYSLSRPGTIAAQIGPVVAHTPTQAIALTAVALQAQQGRSVLIDVPDNQIAFLDWLIGLGFQPRRSLVRMVYQHTDRHNTYPSLPERVFASGGLEVG